MPTNEITADSPISVGLIGRTGGGADIDLLLQKIEQLASLTISCILCADMIPEDEQDRSGLLEQAVFNQQAVGEIVRELTARQ